MFSLCLTLLYLAAHFSQERSHVGIAQNGRLREIPTNMPLRQRHLLCLKVQCNPPNLLTISLQPFFSKLSAIRGVPRSLRVAGGSIDFVQHD
jgi:hypothetical protein